MSVPGFITDQLCGPGKTLLSEPWFLSTIAQTQGHLVMEELVTPSSLIRLENIYQIYFTCVATMNIKFYYELMWCAIIISRHRRLRQED